MFLNKKLYFKLYVIQNFFKMKIKNYFKPYV